MLLFCSTERSGHFTRSAPHVTAYLSSPCTHICQVWICHTHNLPNGRVETRVPGVTHWIPTHCGVETLESSWTRVRFFQTLRARPSPIMRSPHLHISCIMGRSSAPSTARCLNFTYHMSEKSVRTPSPPREGQRGVFFQFWDTHHVELYISWPHTKTQPQSSYLTI